MSLKTEWLKKTILFKGWRLRTRFKKNWETSEAVRQRQAAQGMMGVPETRNAMLENNDGPKLPTPEKTTLNTVAD